MNTTKTIITILFLAIAQFAFAQKEPIPYETLDSLSAIISNIQMKRTGMDLTVKGNKYTVEFGEGNFEVSYHDKKATWWCFLSGNDKEATSIVEDLDLTEVYAVTIDKTNKIVELSFTNPFVRQHYEDEELTKNSSSKLPFYYTNDKDRELLVQTLFELISVLKVDQGLMTKYEAKKELSDWTVMNEEAFFKKHPFSILALKGRELEYADKYYFGKGVPVNYKEALYWYERTNSDAYAMEKIGEIHYSGKAGSTNYKEAAVWYEKAANKGRTYSMYSIGWMYEKGQGVNLNIQKAIMWYEKASLKGHGASSELLGDIYFEGTGVNQDLNTAVKWYAKAFEQEKNEPAKKIALIYYDAGMYVQAEQWFTKAIEKKIKFESNIELCKIGKSYFETKKYAQAVEYYKKASDKGCDWGHMDMARIYYKGQPGVPKNVKTARYWYKKTK